MGRPISNRLKRETKTLRQALGTVVTRLRVERNWSQGEVSQKSGYTTEYLGIVERGKANPSFQLLVVLADIFDIHFSQLLARAERLHRKQAAKPQAKS